MKGHLSIPSKPPLAERHVLPLPGCCTAPATWDCCTQQHQLSGRASCAACRRGLSQSCALNAAAGIIGMCCWSVQAASGQDSCITRDAKAGEDRDGSTYSSVLEYNSASGSDLVPTPDGNDVRPGQGEVHCLPWQHHQSAACVLT